MTAIERLLAMLERAREWPTDTERRVRQDINTFAAFRESDTRILQRLANWPATRPYVVDNLPERISGAYADLLFGEDPKVTAAAEADQDALNAMLADAPAALHAAEDTNCSEGEVYWRLCIDKAASLHPLITWHSRADVVPLLNGRNVVAVAFVSMLGAPTAADVDRVADADNPARPCWRHLEIHAEGTIENHLYRGTWTKLGAHVELATHPDVSDLPEAWPHGLSMLAGRIVNRWGRRPVCGISEYAGVWTRFLVLNEAVTIGRENLRLTAKKRAVIPGSALRAPAGGVGAGLPTANGPDGERASPAKFDAGEDVFVHDPLDTDDSGGNGPFKVLEYSFDAAALIAYMEHEADKILTRCNIVPQFVGSGDFGIGASGTALRVRLLPTVNAAQGKARPWDRDLPHIFHLAEQLEAMPQAAGGLGASWAKLEPPTVKRTEPLPEDPNEVAQRHSTLKTADLLSTERSIRERNPNWTDDQVNAELDAIRADQASTMPLATFGAAAPPADQGSE